MQKATIFLGTTIINAISGCSTFTKQGVDAKAVAEIKGQTVTYMTREKPGFAARTPGKAAFALVGAIAMVSGGNSIISTHEVADPADGIAIGLASELKKAYGIAWSRRQLKLTLKIRHRFYLAERMLHGMSLMQKPSPRASATFRRTGDATERCTRLRRA